MFRCVRTASCAHPAFEYRDGLMVCVRCGAARLAEGWERETYQARERRDIRGVDGLRLRVDGRDGDV